MRMFLDNIKQDLELFSREHATVTLSREDVEMLVKAYEEQRPNFVKREIKDVDGLIDDTLYCINDNGSLVFSIDNYTWSAIVENEKDIDDYVGRPLDPYGNREMQVDLRDLMKEMYDEMKPTIKRERNFERDV